MAGERSGRFEKLLERQLLTQALETVPEASSTHFNGREHSRTYEDVRRPRRHGGEDLVGEHAKRTKRTNGVEK